MRYKLSPRTVISSLHLVVWLCLLLLLPAAAQAQGGPTIRFETIGAEEGLPQSSINTILQDRQGFLWFGTLDGLYKYDGYSFTTYQPDPQQPTSTTTVSHKSILSLYEDQAGVLWIGTDGGGLNKFDPATETFTHYRREPGNPHSLSHDAVWTIYEDRAGALWVGADDGFNRFDRATETFTTYWHDPDNPGQPVDSIRVIYQDRAGLLWLGSIQDGGLHRFDPATNSFLPADDGPDIPAKLQRSNILSILEDQHGMLWVGTFRSGLYKFDPVTETWTNYQHHPETPGSLPDNTIFTIYADRAGRLWVGTNGGLSSFEPERETFTTYRHNPINPHSLSHDVVLSIYEDRSGVLWIGAKNGSLSKLNPTARNFTIFQHDPTTPNSLSDNSVWSVYEDRQGIVWVGAGKGLNKFDPTSQTFAVYQHNPRDPNSLSHDVVVALFEDSQGQLWVGTDNGLNRFEPDRGAFSVYHHDPADPHSLPGSAIGAITEDRSGNLWIGAMGGLSKFERDSESFTNYLADPANPEALSDSGIWALLADRAGRFLWIGTGDGGLNKFDLATGKFKAYQPDPANPDSINDVIVLAIHEDQTGTLWVGTFAGGLNKFDPATETFRAYTTADGLANDSIYGIEQDGAGRLWLSTVDGLSRFEPETETFENYYTQDGLPGDNFNVRAHHKNERGQMFFGGANGLVVFDPAQIEVHRQPPPVALTAFQKFNQPVTLDRPLSQLTDLTLSYQDYVFSFEFTALDYVDPDQNQYAYKLEGFDPDWVQSGNRRFAPYTNLDGGDYVFRVKAANSRGVWNEEGLTINLTVTPPWWETWWFLSLVGLLITGAVGGGFALRLRAIETQRRQLEIQVAERTQELQVAKEKAEVANQAKSAFLATMTHELRTPLNGILGYAQILKRAVVNEQQRNGLDIIEHSGRHLLALINDVLDLAKIESGRIELYQTNFNLPAFLKDISDLISIRAEKNSLYFRLEADDRRLPAVVFGDERRLRQILLNLLGNAIKFTEKGGVTLRVWPVAGQPALSGPTDQELRTLRFEVEDTGIGILPEDLATIFAPFQQAGHQKFRTQGTGLGLAISRNLVAAMGGDLQVKSLVGVGSTFWFSLTLPEISQPAAEGRIEKGQITGIKHCQTCAGALPTALIVDDNWENRAVLVDLLSPLGFQTVEAANGREGLATAETLKPDVLITDLIMPEMDGFELISQFRRRPELKNKVIIATSASVYEEDQKQSLAAGSDAFLPKPVEPDFLFDQLQQLLGLEWQVEAQPDEGERLAEAAPFVLPPVETLTTLLERVEIGDIFAFQQELAALAESDEQYRPFAARLKQLAQGFELNKLTELLEGYLHDEPGPGQ